MGVLNSIEDLRLFHRNMLNPETPLEERQNTRVTAHPRVTVHQETFAVTLLAQVRLELFR